MVATVSKSQNSNVVLITTQNYSADYLLDKAGSWKHLCKTYATTAAEKPNDWIRVVAHGVPIQLFIDQGLGLFKDKCNIFNPVNIIGNPRWLKDLAEGK